MAKYVMHDEARWRVVAETTLDDEPAYELSRRILQKNGHGLKQSFFTITARVRECGPDQHERVKTWRNAEAILRLNPKTGIVTVSEPRSHAKITTTLGGILQMCQWQQAARELRSRVVPPKSVRRKRS